MKFHIQSKFPLKVIDSNKVPTSKCYNFQYFKILILKYELFEFSLLMKGFDLHLIKSHKQIPTDPQLLLANNHAHYASARESSNQIQIKLRVLK